jgi:dTMP kinase
MVEMTFKKDVQSGFFLVIEGLDGSGKTTQCIQLCKMLKSQRINVVYTSEPSKGSIGMFLRKHVLSKSKYPPEIEALLFAADRFEHQQDVIKPALDTGKIVLCDRYLYASLAYQGAQGVDLEWIRSINFFTLKPDLSIYLDVPPEEALARKEGLRETLEYIELERKVKSIYLALSKTGELTRVDGRGTIEEVTKRLFDLIKPFLSPDK